MEWPERRQQFEDSVRRRLKAGPAADRAAAAITADAEQLAAWLVEYAAHPPYPPRPRPVIVLGEAAGGEGET